MSGPGVLHSAASPSTAVPLPIEAIADFCRRWRVAEFALFGSILRPDFRPDSDVDVMVTFEEDAKPTFLDLAEMQEALEGLFGRKVDLVTRAGVEQSLNWYRRRAILGTAKEVYSHWAAEP